MSTTPDKSPLDAARERLEKAVKQASFLRWGVVYGGAHDMRLVLDALRDARRQAFEEAEEALEQLRYASSENDLRDGVKAIAALAAKEQS